VVPGRLGAYQLNAPYSNPFGLDAPCAGNCVAASSPNQGDGYKSCKAYTRPVTVWRQNAPTFDASKTYKICSSSSGKCLDVGTGTANGVDAMQWTFSSTTVSQKWNISATDGGYYKIVNKSSGKCLDIWQGQQTDGARVVQWDYWAGANQNWAIEPVGGGAFSIVGRHSSKARDVKDLSTANGGKVQQWYYYGQPNQIWTIALNP
jgi:hypothetical protein